jgi:serine/threonine protein kinase
VIGKSLGQYEIVAKLGAGGMGEVYRAHDTRLGRDVALKILPPELGKDADRVQRFEQEARAAAALSHPNILAVYDIGSDQGLFYVASELLEGSTLRDALAQPVTPARACAWAGQVALGLAAAHARHIVHRDIKPENLFLTADGRVKILDFGLARVGASASGDTDTMMQAPRPNTQAGVVLGTVAYMSPEQARAPSRRRTLGHFFAGRRVVRDARGSPAVWRRVGGRVHARHTHRRSTGLRSGPRDSANARSHRPPLPREASRGSVPFRARPGPRARSRRRIALARVRFHGGGAIRRRARGQYATSDQPRGAGCNAADRCRTRGRGDVHAGPSTSRRAADVPAHHVPPRHRVESARFEPGSKNVVYSARWQGDPPSMFSVHPNSAESQVIGQPGAIVLAVSASEAAVLLRPRLTSGLTSGTLATMPLGGSGARELATGVVAADLSRRTGGSR